MKDPGSAKPSFPCKEPGCGSTPFSTKSNRDRHVGQKHSPPIIMPCGRERAKHESNTKRHIKNCPDCQREMKRLDGTGTRPEPLDGVAKDTTRALLEGCQDPQQRTLPNSGISRSSIGPGNREINHRDGKESDLHAAEFPQVDATKGPGIPDPWLASPDDPDPRSLGFEARQALSARGVFEIDAQHHTVDYSGAEFEQVYSPTVGETPDYIPADWTPMPFFEDAFWVTEENLPG